MPEWQTSPGSEAAGDALVLATTEARNVALTFRAPEAAAATRAAPLIALQAKGVHTRGWLGAAREEQDVPLLLMPA